MVMVNQLTLAALFIIGVGLCAQLHYRQNALWLVVAAIVVTGSAFLQLIEVDFEPTIEQVTFNIGLLLLAMAKIDHAITRFTLDRRRDRRPVIINHRKEEMQND